MNALQFSTERQVAKLTVEDFLLLDRSGAFAAYRKTELIDGTVVFVNGQLGKHLRVKTRLLLKLADMCGTLGGGLEAWSEGSIAMPPHSVPEPDVFITNATPPDGLVPLASVILVCEVADSTVRDDLGKKAELYAANGIPEYWVIDFPRSLIHQMWSPSKGLYAQRREVALGQPVTAATIDGLSVDTIGLV